MDYKEKFEDFLDRMQGLLDNAKRQGHIIVRVEDLENAFPELKESEGERIRKWCIAHFKECINVIKDNDEYKEYLSNKVIAWLEKQVSPNMIADAYLRGCNDTEKKWLEKRGKHNPDWSEEDEMIALSIEQVMNCASLLNIVPEKIDKIRTWLKSLKERVQLK